MDSFIYSINSTVPIFLVMILGWVIKQLGIIDDNFASKANKYVFKVALPVLLFRDLSATDFKSQFDAKFVIYCMVVTILMFSIIWILTEIFMKDESMKGEALCSVPAGAVRQFLAWLSYRACIQAQEWHLL